MTENQIPNPNPPQNPNRPPSNSRVSGEPGHTGNHHYPNPTEIGDAHKHRYPNPPDAANPDAATLREQWKFAKRQYSRWYSQAWGSAILAGMAFFALGWVIKGGNPLPSSVKHGEKPNQEQKRHGDDVPGPPVPPPLTSSPSDAHEIPKS